MVHRPSGEVEGWGAMTIPIPVRFMMILKARPVMDEPALNQNSAGLRTAA